MIAQHMFLQLIFRIENETKKKKGKKFAGEIKNKNFKITTTILRQISRTKFFVNSGSEEKKRHFFLLKLKHSDTNYLENENDMKIKKKKREKRLKMIFFSLSFLKKNEKNFMFFCFFLAFSSFFLSPLPFRHFHFVTNASD